MRVGGGPARGGRRQGEGKDNADSPGQSAVSTARVVAADTFGAHLHFQKGEVEGVRRALDRAETAVINLQRHMHGLRIAIGDAEEDDDEK